MSKQNSHENVLGASVRHLRPKAGLPFMRTFDDARRSPKYSAIAAALRDSVDSEFHERDLSRYTGRLIHFMETYLGRDSKHKPRPNITKFPIHLFSDYEENGALYHMFHTLIKAREEHKWDSIDLRNDDRREVHFAMFRKMTEVLKRSGHLPIIKVFFSPKMPSEESAKLQHILQIYGAVVVSKPDLASHIIYPDPPDTKEDETDAQVLVRYIEKDGKQARVHWWFHPDSYDDWIPAEHVIGRIEEPDENRQGPWHLQARWVRDLDLYHEWMNELDYELPETSERVPAKVTANGFSQVYELPTSNDEIAQESEAALKIESKTKSIPDTPSDDVPLARRRKRRSSLRKRNEDKAEDEDEDEDEDRVTPIDEDEDEDSDEEVLSEEDDNGSGDDFVPNGDIIMDDVEESNDGDTELVAEKAPEYTVPSFSTWFDLSEINEIEKKAFPEYFSGKYESKTPAIYQEIRNYFVNNWREKPRKYLTVTSTRGKLIGDACAILRVHQFLEHWGLINNAVAPDTLPLPILSAPPAAVPAVEDSRGSTLPFLFDDGSIACVTDSRVFATTPNGSPKKRPRHSKRALYDRPGGSESDEGKDEDGSPKKNTVDYHCDICSRDCSTLRFHCATQSDMDLCETCYMAKKYDTTKMQPRDFIQMKSAGGGIGSQEVDDQIWTESETLLLLEALEMYEDNWELVAEHVGSKNKDQCVMQFVRLPIEDRFLDNPPGDWSQPAKPSDMAPVEMLKKAGANKEALARVSSKTALPLPYSGRPLIYGPDPERSDAPASLALRLSALTSKKLIAKPYTIMLEGLREEGMRGDLNDLIPEPSNDNDDDDVIMIENKELENGLNESDKSGEGKSVAHEKTPEFAITTQEPYRKIKASLPTAEEAANSDLGIMASEALLEQLKDNEEFRSLLEVAEKEMKAQDRASANIAMAAAAGRADQLGRLERAELDRLITMAFEIKANLIRIKLQHYESLSKHEDKAKEIIADEAHTRFAREMRAHHRYTIRDPAAMPPLHGPIGAERVHVGEQPKVPSKLAAPFSSDSASTKLIAGTSIRTISKPPHMPHISPAQFFAQQLEKARLEQEKAEKERLDQLEKIRAEKLRLEREKIERAQKEAEKINAANIQQQIYQRRLEQARQVAVAEAQVQHQLAQQQAQGLANAGAHYANGIVSQHQVPNGGGSVQGTPVVANGIHRPEQQQVTPMATPLTTSIQNAAASPSKPANTDEGNGSISTREVDSTGPKTPTLPIKATPKQKKGKNLKRSRKSSSEKSRKSKRRIVESEDEDQITVAVEKKEVEERSTPAAATLRRKNSKRKSQASTTKTTRADTLLRLRIRPAKHKDAKEEGGRIRKRRTRTAMAAEAAAEMTKTLKESMRPESIPLRLLLKKSAKFNNNKSNNSIVLRLRIRKAKK